MYHAIELKTPVIYTEKLKFKDSLNNQEIELTCDWELKSGKVSQMGKSISKQLEDMGFDNDVVNAYDNIYSVSNIQASIMMMFAGVV